MRSRVLVLIAAALVCILGIWLAGRPAGPGENVEPGGSTSQDAVESATASSAPSAASSAPGATQSAHPAAQPPLPLANPANPGTSPTRPSAVPPGSSPQSPVGMDRPAVTSPPASGSPQSSSPAVAPPPAPPSPASAVTSDAVALDLDKVTLSLRDYRTVMGENPTGTNAEITAALNGGNKKKARLLPDGQSMNGNGELVDRWGRPYFFHQISRTDTEIRSAGPDGVMWTDDDVIAH